MIEFFEMLNSVSPIRATGYLAFILIAIFIVGVLLESIFSMLFGYLSYRQGIKNNNPQESENFKNEEDE